MELQEDSKLIQNLLRKRDLLLKRDNAHEQIRTSLVILGGGMRGVSGGGSLIALHALGLGDVFDVVVGISTGAVLGAAFLAGQEQIILGTSVYYTELPARLVKYLRRPIVDIDFLESLLRGGREKLDVKAIRECRSEFYIAVTKTPSGQGVLLNAKECADMVTGIKASVAVPGLYGHPVSINGNLFVDGGIGYPFPAKEVVERFKLTDMLVIANRPSSSMQGEPRSFMERLFTPFLLRKTPQGVKELVIGRRYRHLEAINYLEANNDVNWGVICSPDDGTHLLTRDQRQLRKLAENSVQHTLKIFGKLTGHIQLI